MDDKLIKRIDDWNKIKYPNDRETRIIFATLEPQPVASDVYPDIVSKFIFIYIP